MQLPLVSLIQPILRILNHRPFHRFNFFYWMSAIFSNQTSFSTEIHKLTETKVNLICYFNLSISQFFLWITKFFVHFEMPNFGMMQKRRRQLKCNRWTLQWKMLSEMELCTETNRIIAAFRSEATSRVNIITDYNLQYLSLSLSVCFQLPKPPTGFVLDKMHIHI